MYGSSQMRLPHTGNTKYTTAKYISAREAFRDIDSLRICYLVVQVVRTLLSFVKRHLHRLLDNAEVHKATEMRFREPDRRYGVQRLDVIRRIHEYLVLLFH